MHLVGKDILTTHSVYWPTLLMGVGLPVPRQILAHGWWVVGETKMSKSLGNVVDPLALRETFGTDAVRWYLMREMPTGGDASYTPERFLIRYEELANVLGNLASRATSMIVKYRDGVVPDGPSSGLDAAIDQTLQEARSSIERLKVHEAFAAAMDLARAANVYVEERQPWAQAKDPCSQRRTRRDACDTRPGPGRLVRSFPAGHTGKDGGARDATRTVRCPHARRRDRESAGRSSGDHGGAALSAGRPSAGQPSD